MKNLKENFPFEKQAKQDGVILYGAGKVGMFIYEKMRGRDRIIEIWDQNAENLNQSSKIGKICLPNYDYPDKEIPIIICIFSDIQCEKMRTVFQKKGFKNVITYTELSLIGEECSLAGNYDSRICNRCVVGTGGCEAYISYIKKGYDVYVPVRNIACILTLRCSLRCKGCVEYTDLFRKEHILYEADVDDYKKYIGKITEAVGWIPVLMLAGGEFFLYSEWKELVQSCINNKKIGTIQILTNGVCRLDEETAETLKHEKVVLFLDDYGDKIGKVKRKLYCEFKEKLDNWEINYFEINNANGTWYDFGDFQDRSYDMEMKKNVFSQCVCNHPLNLYPDGMLARCGRQQIAKVLKQVDGNANDVIDVGNESIEEIRRKLQELLKCEFLEICNFCDGSRKIIIAGEQKSE
jgi:hypothetical protein